MQRTINAGVSLYRNDITQPPKGGWNINYKSPIYYREEAGPQNKIGAFFFFDSDNESIEVGNNVVRLEEREIRPYNPNLSI